MSSTVQGRQPYHLRHAYQRELRGKLLPQRALPQTGPPKSAGPYIPYHEGDSREVGSR